VLIVEDAPLIESVAQPLRLRMLDSIYALCGYRDTFTVDELRDKLEMSTLPSNVVTGALRIARAREWCYRTDFFVSSRHPGSRNRKIRVWRSARVLPEWDGQV
jgi:hypothetical protein